jgi:hypothetical protein
MIIIKSKPACMLIFSGANLHAIPFTDSGKTCMKSLMGQGKGKIGFGLNSANVILISLQLIKGKRIESNIFLDWPV